MAYRDYSQMLTNVHMYKTYSWKPYAVYYLLIIVLVVILGVIALLQKNGYVLLFALLAVLPLFALTALVLWVYQHTCLYVGQEGIIYASPAYTLYSPWSNISRFINLPRTRFELGGKMIQLHNAAERPSIEQGIQGHYAAIEIQRVGFWPSRSYSSYDEYHFIPLRFLSDTVWKVGLTEELSQYKVPIS